MYVKNHLTVVIPCKNEGLTILKTLSLLNQQYQIEGTEVIIADSSDDGEFTRNLINSFDSNLRIKIVDGGLPSIARNLGSERVKTKYVLFLDADILIEDQFLIRNILIGTREYDLHLTTCKITTKDEYRLAYSIFDWIRSTFLKKSPFAIGGFMLFNYQQFKKIDRFDESAKIAEDYQISRKIDSNKFRIFNYTAFTSSRRFKNKGLLYMIRIMIECWINRNNPQFYQKDYNYFK